MSCRNSRPLRQSGAALIIAMLVFALATTLAVAMSREFTLLLKRGSNAFLGEQTWAYLLGGEELAALALRRDIEQDTREQRQRDALNEPWAQHVPPYALDEGGWLVGQLEDLQGRFNLNSVVGKPPQGRRFSAAQEQFIRLLQTPDEPRVSEQDAILILESLLDWLDADREPRNFGAEDDYYYDMTPPYRAANRRLHSVSELRLVAYVTAEIFSAVSPYLTVWGDGAVINVHTAPAPVLRTLNSAGNLAPLNPEEGDVLISMRDEEGFESVQSLLDSPVLADRQLAPELVARLAQTSAWFLYAGQVEVAGRVAHLYSVLRRDGARIKAVVRSAASL